MYGLDRLNEEYRQCINSYKRKRKADFQLQQLFCDFNVILRSDSQLPYELLPDGWLGDEAYLIYQRAVRHTPLAF